MNELLPSGYVPKSIEAYTDKQIDDFRGCDLDHNTAKWLKTIDRIKAEFNDSLKLWMENTRPLNEKELKQQFNNEWNSLTYKSTQATKCAGCGEYKHTPLRRDQMGGYVCLTCIDKELDKKI